MSTDMLALARMNATKASVTNVKFVEAAITSIPLQSESVDCVINNCVINLLSSENKKTCFGEVFRLLKPGGRLAVSDTLANKRTPGRLQRDMGLYVGCISGASQVREYEAWLKEVGFSGRSHSRSLRGKLLTPRPNILIVDKKIDLNIYKERDGDQVASSCCNPTTKETSRSNLKLCCAPTSSCCPTMLGNNAIEDVKGGQTAVADLDFNEWVVKF
jgi:arsenite methyltransferase